MIRVSVTSYLATATLTVSSEDASYPRANFAIPTKPGTPWKTTGTGDSWLVADLGSAKSVDVGAMIHGNIASFKLQGHTSDTWGAPSYDSGALTIARGPNGRYQHAHRPAASQSFRFWRWFIPTQTPTDGASVFALGGGWLGALLVPPRDLLYDGMSVRVNEPRLDEQPPHRGWRQRSRMGLSYVTLSARRLAHQDTGHLYTEWQAWLDLERQWAESDAALVDLGDNIPSHAWVMRRLSEPDFDLTLYASAGLECEEIT